MEKNSGQAKDKTAKSKVEQLLELLKKAKDVIAGSPRALRLIWQAQKFYTITLVFLTLVLGAMPLANLWIGKLIVDTVTGQAVHGGFNLQAVFSASAVGKLMPLLIIMTLLELCQSILSSSSRYVETQLGDLLAERINEAILRKTNSFLDITFFESPKFYDNLQLAQNAGHRPMQILRELVSILRAGIHFLVLAGTFLFLQPLICIIVIIFTAPSLLLQFKHSKESWSMSIWETPEVRRMYYYRMVLTDKYSAPEVRMFGLADFFLNKYLETSRTFYQEHKKIRQKHWRQNALSSTLSGIADAGAYSLIALKAISGSISIGSFYFYSNALSQMQGQLGNLLWSFASLYEDNLFLTNLYDFLDTKPTMPAQDPSFVLPSPKPIKAGIEFRNVGFAYQGSSDKVLDALSFTIKPGQTVALVGENGAGKTTIVKLLGRLYDPTEGEILVDGINLKDIDLENWRQQTAVIFQDFANFQMSAGQNIGVGQVNFIDDELRVKAAAERGGADLVVEKLPKGYETLLGNWFGVKEESSDLSGGQWQKIALSRAFMRAPEREINGNDRAVESHLKNGAAQLLVLDEPTASLDVQSEHDIYQRFEELTKDKMTVLISHRFSTVRMANLILLLENGKIVEQGSHEELMELGGEYSRLYKLQADRYV